MANSKPYKAGGLENTSRSDAVLIFDKDGKVIRVDWYESNIEAQHGLQQVVDQDGSVSGIVVPVEYAIVRK